MNAVAPARVLDLWRLQPCDDQLIAGIEHARFALTTHAGHGCIQFHAALRHSSEVCG